ncbi:efflux transporter periplasmic adaptor subunit [Acinetobacter sp. ANC 4558]|uniref:efflux RND transporter periplasmic adaptor subunit n=1 Tax=Acinetobacter sp. ANC 4558 TaxID=1977876 RepID=UPI000A33C029|nr:efflux RND transporter periplasmic adaptor subunit [Acinetobacter sp. ANC 4558]OTG88110.1 efflux transporter periplasmic adaptor subunit [Acinetobacter sp. ANC 4558]
MKNQFGKISQPVLIIGALIITALVAITFWLMQSGHSDEHKHEENEKTPASGESSEVHGEEESVQLTPKQITEQGIKVSKVEIGLIEQLISYPAKLMANTDQQAHVSAGYSGQVKHVYVELGQQVKKGQALATLLVPDLVDQQAQLKIAQTNLNLARQDFERERDLWTQGISAKQDYQRASNAYQQAQVQVQAARSRLSALGGSTDINGQYTLKAPISGVISEKDIVIGEYVQLATQLFVIDQIDQLWLEFIVPNIDIAFLQPNQKVQFKSLQTGQMYQAQIMNLNSTADIQTGRLQVRAKVLDRNPELRPNLMVSLQLEQNKQTQVRRIEKNAVQRVDEKDIVFVPSQHGDKIEFSTQPVQLGSVSSDGKWIEILSGLNLGQTYVSQGSFLLKSELEKGEADHEH